MEKREHYLYVSSNDSKNIYPNNNALDFFVEFPHKIQLCGIWEIAVLEFKLSNSQSIDFAILCDACEVSYINNAYRPILRYIHSETMHSIYHQPIYVKISRDSIERLHFYLMLCDVPSTSFNAETLRCTLHLRKVK